VFVRVHSWFQRTIANPLPSARQGRNWPSLSFSVSSVCSVA
jgi:hypothetical protein